MAIHPKLFADCNLCSLFLADLPLQAAGQILAFLLLASRELPHASEQSMRRSAGDQHLALPDDYSRCDHMLRDGRFGQQHRSLLLDP
jgi:hypothetical protein